ncbi:PREDICTED: mas-related G-protein coupled receptor member H-like [Tinamus guttatus]|uniref:mas-related G-protein coupled receptor member H-like n=1 Tax=Tinamus guttatus TaxID=94827 RepID=UPI00052E761A|nr:PREDICTED: mas-related G-protein coupled receptor member H-like [Tinamus guttatus]
MGICLCGLGGNGMVVWFLGFKMKKNPFTVYIFNLAVADFSVLLLSFLIILVNFCVQGIYFHDQNAIFAFCYWVHAPYYFFHLTGLGLLTALCTERCISVLFPIWYRCSRPKHLSAIVSCVLWAGSVLSTLLVLIIFSSLLLFSNLILFIKLRYGSQRRHPGRLFVAILLNILFFFVFGIPYSVEIILFVYHSNELLPENLSFLLASLNSSINPVIYFLVGSYRQRRFEASVKAAFRRVFAEKTMCEEGSQDLRDTAAESSV